MSLIRNKELVRGVLNKMSTGCTVCWIIVGDGLEKDYTLTRYRRHASVTEGYINKLRKHIKYKDRSHSYHRCGVSQVYCTSGEDVNQACQWPNAVVPTAYMVIRDPAVGGPML